MVKIGGDIGSTSVPLGDAIRELHQHVKAAVEDIDPAPWHEVSRETYEMFGEGDEADYVRDRKMQARTKLIVTRALRSGDLRAHFSDGNETCDIPAWAWDGLGRVEQAWFEGRLPLSIFLPDDWQRWSGHRVFIQHDAFEAWLGKQQWVELAQLPILPAPHDIALKPEKVAKRLPQDTPFVTLSEALTFIAFRLSLDSNGLYRAIASGGFEDDYETKLKAAVAEVTALASGGLIAVRGKYIANHWVNEKSVLTELIEPVRFEDFACFDMLHDGLRFGSGLVWSGSGSGLSRLSSDRPDSYRSVKINRADLMRHFLAESTDEIPTRQKPPPNRKLDHQKIIGDVMAMRAARPGISKGSAAASIVAELPVNPTSGKPRDTRHIERIIAHLWEGGLPHPPV